MTMKQELSEDYQRARYAARHIKLKNMPFYWFRWALGLSTSEHVKLNSNLHETTSPATKRMVIGMYQAGQQLSEAHSTLYPKVLTEEMQQRARAICSEVEADIAAWVAETGQTPEPDAPSLYDFWLAWVRWCLPTCPDDIDLDNDWFMKRAVDQPSPLHPYPGCLFVVMRFNDAARRLLNLKTTFYTPPEGEQQQSTN